MIVVPAAIPAFTGFIVTQGRSDFCYPFRLSYVFTLKLPYYVEAGVAHLSPHIENSRSPRYAVVPNCVLAMLYEPGGPSLFSVFILEPEISCAHLFGLGFVRWGSPNFLRILFHA